MDVNAYRQRLLKLELRLSKRLSREVSYGREQVIDTAADAGDASVVDESESEDFTEAELDATILGQVREALRRIQNGTYRGSIAGRLVHARNWGFELAI